MKSHLIILFFFLMSTVITYATDTIRVAYTSVAPEIDGIPEKLWDNAYEVPIEREFQDESPTIEAYWKAMWDDEYIYVLIDVQDEDHWPAWESGGEWYEYDQTEVYFDINDTLMDNLGPGTKGSGHYQAIGLFIEDSEELELAMDSSNYRPAGTYAYTLSGENYTIEYAVKISSMINSSGAAISADYLKGIVDIGFDVTVVDQDEGDTEQRHRAVWQNEGELDECYHNMNDAGIITLVDVLIGLDQTYLNNKVCLYPNPATEFMTVNKDFNRLLIYNKLGQLEKTITESQQKIDISDLSPGMYLVKVYNKGEYLGSASFLKTHH